VTFPRVLIVDDTPLNLAVAVAMLKHEFECITANSAAEARAVGASDYLEKPVPKQLLRARLRHWLNPSAQPSPSEARP